MNDALSNSTKLAVRDLFLDRGGKKFARVLDFDVMPGKSVAMIGASGSGKTTALMAIAGIRPPASGSIAVEGVDPWAMGRRGRDGFRGRRIGLVFQSFHLVDALTVQANVWLAAQCAGYPVQDSDRLNDLLERLGLLAVRHRRADHISHGQAQRVAVARALLNRPALILADEPTSALDDENTKALMTLLTENAASEGAALVIATHDRRVLDCVDSVVQMEVLA